MKVNLTISIPIWLDKIFTCPLMVYRKHKFGGPFRKIPLGDGLFAIVEPQDYYRANNFNWFAKKTRKCIYAYRCVNQSGQKTKMFLMHREIMNPPAGFLIDHKNHNTLDNRRTNLRLATPEQNACNTHKNKSKTTSKFNGVSFDKTRGLWKSQINYHGKTIHIGRFENEVDAARAYDIEAIKHHGEFANLNFPDGQKDGLGDWSFMICYGRFTG